MKIFELKKRSRFDDKQVLTDVVSMHPEKGITIGGMRLLCKILDKLAATTSELVLEDAEHDALIRYFEAFQFAVAHSDLVALHDAIKNAGDPGHTGTEETHR